MRKTVLNIIETLLILVIALVCGVSILQSTFLQNKAIFGYRTYVIASNSMYPVLEYGDVILVEEINFDDIKKGDIVTYFGKEGEVKNKIITHEVIDIINENETTVLKTQGRANTGIDPYVYKDQIYGKFTYRFMLISAISKIIRDKVGFVICILIPFSILFILELISFAKEVKRKELENTMKLQLDELKNIDNKSELSKAIENSINDQIKEIQDAKRDFKKINELEETIRIPLEEIQRQLRELDKKNNKEESNENDVVEDDTVVLFTKDELKEAIKKELDTDSNKVNKAKKNQKTKYKKEENTSKKKKQKSSTQKNKNKKKVS